MTKQVLREIFIPFSGFYNSFHDSALDDAVGQMFTDHYTGCSVNMDLLDTFHTNFNDWGYVWREYSKAYVSELSGEFGLTGLEFKDLISPRYYNFETDRILCTLPASTCRKIYNVVMKECKQDFIDKVKQRFTSCDGFISFYDNDYQEWGDFTSWDCNQLEVLLLVYIEHLHGEEWCQWAEWSICEDFSGNGDLDNWIHKNLTGKALQATNVHYYLEQRKERT